MIKTRFDEEFKKMSRKERNSFYKERFNTNIIGKYIVETKSLICNGYSWLNQRFNTIEDAKEFIKFYCVPNQYGNIEKGRIIHLEEINEYTVKEVVDWEQNI